MTARPPRAQLFGLVLIPLIVGQGVLVGLTAIGGFDAWPVYLGATIAILLEIAAAFEASRIRSTPREKEPGYLIAGKAAVATTAGMLLLASLTLWGVLLLGRGPVPTGFWIHIASAAVMSILSVLNAWRVQPTAATRTVGGSDS